MEKKCRRKNLFNLIFWIVLSIVFNVYIFMSRGEISATEYFGGYIIEMSLSLDNLFLFLMIFRSYGIRKEYEERILLYGVLGAMVLRLIFILAGVTIINKFHFLLSFFGIILLYSGLNMFTNKKQNINYENSIGVKILKVFMPVTNKVYNDKFFIKKQGTLYATPLFVVLIIIECSDIIFAIDSIPAILSITTDTFIVYTSNIFAILGLRSMYYILEDMNTKFKYMKYGVGLILIFTGIKLCILIFNVQISVTNSVLIIMIILLSSILISLLGANILYSEK